MIQMKKIFLLSGLLLTIACSCEKEELIVDEIINNTDELIDQVDQVDEVVDVDVDEEEVVENFDVNVIKNYIEFDFNDSMLSMFSDVNGRFHFTKNGNEYFIYISTNSYSTFLFKRVNNEWVVVDENKEITMVDARNYRRIDDSTFVFVNSGEDFRDMMDWGGYVWIGKIENEKVTYRKVSDVFDYFHSLSVGDITNDGLFDVITNSGWVFIQNEDESFEVHNISPMEGSHYVDYSLYQSDGFSLINKDRLNELENYLESKIYDIFPGGRPEIILNFIDVSNNVTEEAIVPRGDVLIYEFNETSNQYEVVYELPRRVVGEVESINSIQVSDLNGDGINDMVLEVSTGDPNLKQPMEVWLGNDDKTFYKQNEIFLDVATAQFDLFDINSDGFDDIVLRPKGQGDYFIRNWCTEDCGTRQQQGLPVRDGLFIHNAIFINDGSGNFTRPNVDLIIENTYVNWLIPFMRNGNLSYHGNIWNYNSNSGIVTMEFVDIEINNTLF